jgi:hypothetical protein
LSIDDGTKYSLFAGESAQLNFSYEKRMQVDEGIQQKHIEEQMLHEKMRRDIQRGEIVNYNLPNPLSID